MGENLTEELAGVVDLTEEVAGADDLTEEVAGVDVFLAPFPETTFPALKLEVLFDSFVKALLLLLPLLDRDRLDCLVEEVAFVEGFFFGAYPKSCDSPVGESRI